MTADIFHRQQVKKILDSGDLKVILAEGVKKSIVGENLRLPAGAKPHAKTGLRLIGFLSEK